MRPPVKPCSISVEEEAKIRSLAGSRKEPHRLVQRTKVIVAMNEILEEKIKRIFTNKILLFTIFGIIALLNIGYVFYVLVNITNKGLVDFNFYWYSGLFVRQHVNPYEGFLQNFALNFPISFIDGNNVTPGTILTYPKMLPGLPGNTSPFVLLMTLFSFLSLKNATIVWTILNLGLAIVIPIEIMKCLRNTKLKIPYYLYSLAILIFFSLNMTSRGAIGNGQPSLFIFFLMILTIILIDSNKLLLAGLFFGIALSKYNVSLPILVFLFYKKQWKVLITAIIVQIVGILVLSLITTSSPLVIIKDYFEMAYYHSVIFDAFQGINISDYLPKSLIFAVSSFLAITLFVGGALHLALTRMKNIKMDNKIVDVIVLSILFLWALLAVYHLGYDAILTIFPLLIFLVIIENSHLRINAIRATPIIGITLIVLISLIIPGSVFRFITHNNNSGNLIMTLSIIVFLIINIILLFNLPQVLADDSVDKAN
jgi:hypothetical protein